MIARFWLPQNRSVFLIPTMFRLVVSLYHLLELFLSENELFRHLPEYLEGRTPKEKHPFLFQKKFHPHQIRNVRSVFLSGLPRLCEAVAERFIHHWDFARNIFELCPEHTAKKRNRVRMQKYGRHEVPSVLNSPKKVLNPKEFATQSVAPR